MTADFPKHRLEAATFPLDASRQIGAEDTIASPTVAIRRLGAEASAEFTPTVQWDGVARVLYITVQEAESGQQAGGIYQILAMAQRNGEPWVFLTQDARSGEWRLPNFEVLVAGDPNAP